MRCPINKVPRPSIKRIAYEKPEQYVTVLPSMGLSAAVHPLAASLTCAEPEHTLTSIAHWISEHLRCDRAVSDTPRGVDEIIESGVYGSCADHALPFGALARFGGLPTIWVKTMDSDWIHEFRTTGTCETYRGHVYLELFLRDRWMLFDAQRMHLWEEYDPRTRILPINRYAYDKGGDPLSLVLSVDFERWKIQTERFFRRFDLSRLPMPRGRSLLPSSNPPTQERDPLIYIAANRPIYEWIGDRLDDLGRNQRTSFNTGFEEMLPRARGRTLILTCLGDEIVLPPQYRTELLPMTEDLLKERLEMSGKGIASQTLDDGTRIILIFARDLENMRHAVRELDDEML